MKFSRPNLVLLLTLLTFCVLCFKIVQNLFPDENYFIPRKEVTHKLDHTRLISPPDCAGKVDLLILVLSIFPHTDKRRTVRKTWGTWSSKTFNHSLKLVFLLGNYQNGTIQQELNAEGKEYGDILQIDAAESYDTTSNKILMAFKWMEERCTGVKHILKTDDDVFVNLPVVMKTLETQTGMYMFGEKLNLADVHRSGKHRLSHDEYPFFFFPPYLIGYVYFMPSSVARRLLHSSYHTPYLRYEDVYITGILTKATRTQLVQIHPSWLETGKSFVICDFVKNGLVAAADMDSKTVLDIWETFVDKSKCSG